MTPKEEAKQQKVLTEAHDEYQKGMGKHAFFKVNNQETSIDLVQDTFIKTWVYLVRGGKIEIMKAFLYHILNQLIVDEYRKRKTTSLDLLIEKGFEPSIDDSDRLFNIFDGKAALLLIKNLPEKYKEVMRLRYVQLLSIKEISLITGQSKNTVTVQAHRGLGMLRSMYKPTKI